MSKPILCLDFDGVVHSYSSRWTHAAEVKDPPTPGALEAILDYSSHFDVQIFSSRSHQPGGISAMQAWLHTHWAATNFPREALHAVGFPCVKPPALIGLDDRVLTFTGTWPSVATLRAFRPWNKP